MIIPNPKKGDLYLLFHHLPYDFSEELPLSFGPYVCLDITPQAWLDSSNRGMADFLLPGYSLPGMGLNNCCLRCFAENNISGNLTQKELLFLSLLALRLYESIQISIGGQFLVGSDEDRIMEPILYQLLTPWPQDNSNRFSSDAVKKSNIITERLVEIDNLHLTRLQNSLILFSQVTLGLSKSFQLSYLGLFAALEALFVPTGNKAKTLSKRISKFLSNFKFPLPIEAWIKDEYVNGRNKIAHGFHNATFGAKLQSERYEAFGILHEIARLSILGFLSFDNEKLKQLSNTTGNKLQYELDNLEEASGIFLTNQKPAVGHGNKGT